MVDFVPLDWKPRSHINADITIELQHIIDLVVIDCRLPSRDPYLIEVCRSAIREIQQLRARQPKPNPDFLGGPMS
jgi:hypothetical protein